MHRKYNRHGNSQLGGTRCVMKVSLETTWSSAKLIERSLSR